MGWNQLNILKPNFLTNNIPQNSYVYFVHSYYAGVSSNCIASTDYNINMSAIVGTQGVWGCQFHPEDQESLGPKSLKTFVDSTISPYGKAFETLNDVVRPTLAFFLIGNREDSKIYVNIKKKTCKRIGFNYKEFNYSEDVTFNSLQNSNYKM